MNSKNIFLGLSYIGEDLIDEAENGTFSASPRESTRRPRLRKPLLIAALVALMLLCIGCTLVYVLNMDTIKIGKQTWYFDDYHPDTQEYTGTLTYTEQVYSATGTEDTPGYQAAAEWFAFRHSYDPDQSIQKKMEGNGPEFPVEYNSYQLYTWDMKEKLDEICEKYGLKLAGPKLAFEGTFAMHDALGIPNGLVDYPGVSFHVGHGACWEEGNFRMPVWFSFPEWDGYENHEIFGYLIWNRKDCFSDDVITLDDKWEYTEWNYTTASGNQALLIRCSTVNTSSSCIIINRKDGTLVLDFDRRAFYMDEAGRSYPRLLSDRQIEQLADAIDSNIQPKVPKA